MIRFSNLVSLKNRSSPAMVVPIVLGLGLAGTWFITASAAPAEIDKSVLDAQSARIAAIKKVHPAIVAVLMPENPNGGGSGVLISPDGYALTNFHVVETRPFVYAGLADGVQYEAVLVGLDKVGDVALIKLLPKEKGK